MGMTGHRRPTDRPAGEEAAPSWMVGGATIVGFVALLYVIEAIDAGVRQSSWTQDGIRPLETDGLWGILWAPLLHADWAHLIANTVPALVLGFLVTLAGMSRFIYATSSSGFSAASARG